MVYSKEFTGRNLLLYDAKIITLDPQRPRAHSIWLKNGRIVEVFADSSVPLHLRQNDTVRKYSMQGLTLVPGLHDAHIHVQALGAMQRNIDLRGLPSRSACLDLIKQKAAQNPQTKTLFGFGWNDKDWPSEQAPRHQDLQRCCPDRVIVLMRTDGHAAWVSTTALQALAIDDKRADPAGGLIQRDATGQATGLLIDRAADWARELQVKATKQELKQDWLAGIEIAAKNGLSSLHAMSIDAQSWEILCELDEARQIKTRIFAYLDAEDPQIDAMLARWPERTAHGLVQLVGVKLMLDGALGSRGASLCQDYLDAPGEQGVLLWPEDKLRNMLHKVNSAGLQLAVHAIGDRANKLALDLLQTLDKTGISRRHRIEHAQILRPQDFARFARLDLIASMQPSHLLSDYRWAQKSLGAERMQSAYAWNTMAQNKIPLAFGSDAPVEAADPLLALRAACTPALKNDREQVSNHNEEPAQHRYLSREQALRAICQGPAWAVKREDELGTLSPGMLADLSILNADPLDPRNKLSDLRVMGIVRDGDLRFFAETDRLRAVSA